MDPGEKFILDLIKGAHMTEGFMRGGTMNVQRDIMRREEKLANHASALTGAFEQGRAAALAHFKIAFLGAVAPLLGSVAGPALARGAMGKIAPGLAAGLGNGMKGMAFDTAASMAGGAMGQKMTGPQ